MSITLQQVTSRIFLGQGETRLIIRPVVTHRGPPGSGVVGFVSLTEDTDLVAAASGTRYNNTGAVADLVATLPAATVDQLFSFRVSSAFNLGIAPEAGETILLDEITVTDTQQLQCASIGGVIDLECHDDGVWIVTNIRREWALEAL